MKELKKRDDFLAIKNGEKITKVTSDKSRGLRLVGRMPGSENYLIFSDGEHLEHLYIHVNDEKFENFHSKNIRWFSGKYDSKTIGQVMIENLNRRIESVKKIYFEDE